MNLDRIRIHSPQVISIALLSISLAGCASTLSVRPALPTGRAATTSSAKVGIFIPPSVVNREEEIKPGSGIWPGTKYTLKAGEILSQDLVNLTRRHFPNSGPAEKSIDGRWEYVAEFRNLKPFVEAGTLRSVAPLQFSLRNSKTGKEIDSVRLSGEGEAPGGRISRSMLGRLTEKKALEKTLTEAYTDLYGRLDGYLARVAAKESQPPKAHRPYRRGKEGKGARKSPN